MKLSKPHSVFLLIADCLPFFYGYFADLEPSFARRLA